MSTYNGTNGFDRLDSSNWDFNWDYFHMKLGDDYVDTQSTSTAYIFYGDGGKDTFFGNALRDEARGGDGNDILVGRGGNDYFDGQDGNDIIVGGTGEDYILGRQGKDALTGSEGSDIFSFGRYDSPVGNLTSDLLLDWNTNEDYIQTTAADGTASNYVEKVTKAKNVEQALDQIEKQPALLNKTYVYLYNHTTDKGYLFVNVNNNHQFDIGISISHGGSSLSMNYDHLLDLY